jgi:hypothetical protein
MTQGSFGRPLAAALALAALASLGAGIARAAEPKPQPELLGAPMSAEELRAFHAGHNRSGCYLGRPEEPVWRERMAEDGRLYDLLRGGALVGSWWIEEEAAAVCFRYTDRTPGPFCFNGRRRGSHHDFYSAGTNLLVTTTECNDEPVA